MILDRANDWRNCYCHDVGKDADNAERCTHCARFYLQRAKRVQDHTINSPTKTHDNKGHLGIPTLVTVRRHHQSQMSSGQANSSYVNHLYVFTCFFQQDAQKRSDYCSHEISEESVEPGLSFVEVESFLEHARRKANSVDD